MGWGSGSMLAEELWDMLQEVIPTEKQQEVAKKIIRLFEDRDCDTLDECQDLINVAGPGTGWHREDN